MAKQTAVHRAGSLKQQNKPHKAGRHRVNSARRQGGRVPVKTFTRQVHRNWSKQDRRHRAWQLRRQHQEAVLEEKRNLGRKDGPPHLMVLVPLHTNVDPQLALNLFRSHQDSVVFPAKGGPPGSLHAVLDLAKVADTLLFLLDAADGWDAVGDHCLSCIFAQGLPSYGLAVQGLAEQPPKKQTDYRKKLSKATEKRFPGARLFPLHTEQESALLLQHLASQKQQHLAFRDRRAHLLADVAEFVPSSDSAAVGTLKVSGYVRGHSLNVNSLVHVVGHGDFQMNQMDAPPDLFALNPKGPGGQLASRKEQGDLSSSAAEMEEEVKVLSTADPAKQESLQAEGSKKIAKKVPKGTSAYQAAWILDKAEWGSGSEEEEEEEEEVLEEAMSQEEEAMLEKYRQERQEEMFPDEVDTPRDVPARVRFQKFRGLKSFRTSPWDPKENLPRDYARIFQFQDFSRTKKHIFRQLEKEQVDGAQVGWYVTVHLCNVPVSVLESFEQKQEPLVLFTRHPGYSEPVKSKEDVIVHCGFRRFRASPLYSQHTSGAQNLLATGSLLSVDPNRLVVKRVVLSGHPFKIFSKLAVVRYMFFNRGTHGHMKCQFDGQLKSQDTVLMTLYKRVFPRWTFDPYVPEPMRWRDGIPPGLDGEEKMD
ncbi:hypothetical protein E2320_006820 [Naja naja]|nr:hypothetical protein E2320_006820 [Naja naja]